MPNFVYTTDIPDGPHNPSADQPPMKINTNSINSLISVDHYSFNDNLGGLHKQVQMPVKLAIPAGLLANEGTLYTKTVNARSELFYTPDVTAKEFQLTRSIIANYALFATNTVYPQAPPVPSESGGLTFLPGGILLEYGSHIQASITPSLGTTKFPVAFTSTPFVVLVTPICKAGGTSESHTVSVVNGSISSSSFQWNWDTTTSSYVGFSWIAIGI